MKRISLFPGAAFVDSDLPLRIKVRRICAFSFGTLLLAFFSCVLSLYYCAQQYQAMFGVNYTQSTILNQAAHTNELLADYQEFPSAESAEELRRAVAAGQRAVTLLDNLPSATDEQHMLATAISRTYATYADSIDKLLTAATVETSTQAFHRLCNECYEIGGYVDTYLKQLIQQTLSDGQDEYQAQLHVIWFSLVVIIALLFFSGFMMLYLTGFVTQRIARPITVLASAAQSLAANHMDIPDVPAQTNDEIGILTRNFNRMKADCRQLLVTQQEKEEITRHLFDEHLKRTETERQLSAARFSALKNQINPHFLFNTLNLVTQTAQQEQDGQTEKLVRQLSDLLRYTLYNTHDRVPLSTELDVLYSYMNIQEARFPDLFGFWVDCRIDPESVEIPSFILQPLVENAMRHGIRPKNGGGLVRVKVSMEGAFVRITVTDNGVGMPPEVLRALRDGTYQPKKSNSGIGVLNVAARVKMLYPTGDFRIFSRPGLGTCMKLIYPAVTPQPQTLFEERGTQP